MIKYGEVAQWQSTIMNGRSLEWKSQVRVLPSPPFFKEKRRI